MCAGDGRISSKRETFRGGGRNETVGPVWARKVVPVDEIDQLKKNRDVALQTME